MKAIILRTMLVLMIGHKTLRNPMSLGFFDANGKAAKLSAAFSNWYIPSAPYDAYLTLLRAEYLEYVKKGYTLLQCAEPCNFIFFVDSSKHVIGSPQCLLCQKKLNPDTAIPVPIHKRTGDSGKAPATQTLKDRANAYELEITAKSTEKKLKKTKSP